MMETVADDIEIKIEAYDTEGYSVNMNIDGNRYNGTESIQDTEVKLEDKGSDELELPTDVEIELEPTSTDVTSSTWHIATTSTQRSELRVKLFRCDHVETLITGNTNHWKKPLCDSQTKLRMRIHTGEKPYKCTLCDYQCSQSGNLSTNMRRHTGGKPYKCTLCNYQCSNSSNLSTHMRIHTGEKRYNCTLCDYQCSQSSSLSSHMRIHSG